MGEKKKYTKIDKPADFKPETYFPDDWKVEHLQNRPRCPAWSGQKAAQCGQLAGSGTKRKEEVGACCSYHGGASNGAPKGSKNAADPDKPRSQFIRLDDLPLLEQFSAMLPKDRADLMSNIMLMRAAKTLQTESGLEGDELKAEQPLIDARLIELTKAADRSLRTIATFIQLERGNPDGADKDGDGTDESRVETAFGLLEQLAEDGDGEEDS